MKPFYLTLSILILLAMAALAMALLGGKIEPCPPLPPAQLCLWR